MPADWNAMLRERRTLHSSVLIAAAANAGAAIKAIKYRGVSGTYTFANDDHTPLSYPNTTDDPEAGQSHLIFQVQDGQHIIISPEVNKQADLRPAPWM